MKNAKSNLMSEKSQMIKSRFEMLTKINESFQKVNLNKFKEASSNKKITFVNLKG
ncbi:hypothetical protein G5B30_16765 [Sphingobacterium sp. SGG-5]|uniref:hypothetical protein n=1 Tax=Sphingobacterium sp. SGG-5 TaxID=2710881 RepID=UPI0013EBEF2F|nr:hypothetical protein [Sphingobacterium sp. SGG-5]NGM63563.1 hypothetical protein [Sphingobacterium sp. SGG-5]